MDVPSYIQALPTLPREQSPSPTPQLAEGCTAGRESCTGSASGHLGRKAGIWERECVPPGWPVPLVPQTPAPWGEGIPRGGPRGPLQPGLRRVLGRAAQPLTLSTNKRPAGGLVSLGNGALCPLSRSSFSSLFAKTPSARLPPGNRGNDHIRSPAKMEIGYKATTMDL